MNTISKPTIASLFFFITLLNYCHAQWVSHGPSGGIVQCMAAKDSFIYAGTESNGIFRSADKGVSWEHLTIGLPAYRSVQSLLVKGSAIYAGIDYETIYVSTNNGTSWTAAGSNDLPIGYFYTLRARDSSLFAGTNKGLYRSQNGGQNWTSMDSVTLGNFFVRTIVFKDSNIFIGTNSGIYVSHDNANSWTFLNGIGLSSCTAMLVKDSLLFVGTTGGLIYRSADNGNQWTNVSTGIPAGYWWMGSISDLGYVGDSLFASTFGNGLFLSVNNGNSWAPVNTGLGAVAYNSILISDSSIYVGTGSGGVYPVPSNAVGVIFSADGGNAWSIRNNGLINTYASCLLVKDSTIYTGVEGLGVFKSTDNGNNWSPCSNGLGVNRVVFSLGALGSNLYAGTHTGMFLSTDSANTWTSTNNGFPSNTGVLSITVSDTNIFAGTISGGVALSTNHGLNWSGVNNGLGGNYISAMASIGSHIYAGTQSQGVYLTTNNGANWTAVNTDLNSNQIISLAAHDSILYVATWSGGVYKSNNLGANWTLIDIVRSLSTINVNDTGIFVGTTRGYLYYSPDTGASWNLINDPALPGSMPAVYSIAFSSEGVFTGTGMAGVWEKTWTSFHHINTAIYAHPTVCGDSTGSVKVSVTGGPSLAYSYTWSNGAASDSVSRLGVGTYMVTITSGTVTVVDSVTIVPSSVLDVLLDTVQLTCDSVMFIAHVQGGFPPYHYSWNTGSADSIAIVPANQAFSLNVSDSFTCQLRDSGSFVCTGISATGAQQSTFNISPNPASEQVNIQIDQALLGAQLTIYNITGAIVQTEQLQAISNQLETGKLPTGIYIAEVRTKDTGVKRRWVKM